MTFGNILLHAVAFAQANAPVAAETAKDGAATTAEPSAALEAAKEAALKNAEAEAGHGHGANLLDLWKDLNDVEKGVMVILLVFAVISVALLFEKVYVMRTNNKRVTEFLEAFRKAKTLEEAEAKVKALPASGIKSMFTAGVQELRLSRDLGAHGGAHTLDRVRTAMAVKQNEHIEDISSMMTFLASIASNAPFIGLFGTVWGIMNSFIGIVKTQSTSLVAVAPGIAGALLATAAGLVAAIPAGMIYNYAGKQISKNGGKMEDFREEFIALASREMDRGA